MDASAITRAAISSKAPVAPPLVERDAELVAIARVLDGSLAGAGRALVIDGEAGAGKTRLLAEAETLAEERGLECLRARGRRPRARVRLRRRAPAARTPAVRARRDGSRRASVGSGCTGVDSPVQCFPIDGSSMRCKPPGDLLVQNVTSGLSYSVRLNGRSLLGTDRVLNSSRDDRFVANGGTSIASRTRPLRTRLDRSPPADSAARIAPGEAGVDASLTGCLAVVQLRRLSQRSPGGGTSVHFPAGQVRAAADWGFGRVRCSGGRPSGSRLPRLLLSADGFTASWDRFAHRLPRCSCAPATPSPGPRGRCRRRRSASRGRGNPSFAPRR
jgi:hypothetical protein